MKKLIFKSTVLIVVPIFVVSIIMLLKKDDWSRLSHEVNVVLAYNRLDSLRGTNKIVIVAGSNGSFSINSEIIEDSLHMPVVNTSTHAGLGVRMQFEIYKDFLEKGDVVIFCPEYYADKSKLYGESTLLRILSTHMPAAYLKMSLPQWIYIFKYIGIHYKEANKNHGFRHFDGPYAANSVNRYGDVSYYREQKGVKDIYRFMGSMDDETTSYYRFIHDYTKQKGITLIYLPPTLMKKNYINQKPQIDSLALFMSKNRIPFRSMPERFVFDDSLFYDTPYHMTSRGAAIRTVVMVDEIKKVLGDCAIN